MSLSSRGRLIYEEDDKIYRRSIIFEKIWFYTLLMGLPILLTIFLGTVCLLGIESMGKDGLLVLAFLWFAFPFLAITTSAPTAFADKLRIYENGFVPPKLPSVSIALRVFLRKISAKDVFVRYDEITYVLIQRFPKSGGISGMLIRTKDGLVYIIQRGDVGWRDAADEPLNKLVEVLKEKRPEVIEEQRLI